MVDDGGVARAGLVGMESDAVRDALVEAGLTVTVGEPATLDEPTIDVLVAVGEQALLSVGRERPDVPVLPVDAGAGVRAVQSERVPDAATALLDGDFETERHPLLSIEGAHGESLALLDAMLVTAEPAHISEYTVTTGDDRVAKFRADGVVAATPAGTHGYAGDAGAPVMPPEAGVLAIVPVAPFATNLDHWVVPDEGLTITVERDTATVEVLADDRTVGRAAVGQAVDVSADGAIRTVQVSAGLSPFARHRRELEKL